MSPKNQITAAVLMTASAILAACGGQGAESNTPVAAPMMSLSPDNIAIAQRSTITSGPAISGTLVADRTASIRAEVPGSVLAVLLDPGSPVSNGTPLVRIDDSAIRDAFLSAKSGVTQADLAADIAKREQSRAEKLLAAGAIAANVVEIARRSALGAAAALDDAKARLASAQKQMDHTVVKAPYDGIVSERQVNPGDVVAPGAPLVTIVDPSTMRLEGSVPADQLANIRVGAPVTFTVTGYPNRIPWFGQQHLSERRSGHASGAPLRADPERWSRARRGTIRDWPGGLVNAQRHRRADDRDRSARTPAVGVAPPRRNDGTGGRHARHEGRRHGTDRDHDGRHAG